MAKLTLLSDQIAVQRISEEERASGILLPGTVKKERPQIGIVKFVGPGKLLKDGSRTPMDVKVGDTVIFGGWSDATKIEDEEYYFISIDDVKAIIQ